MDKIFQEFLNRNSERPNIIHLEDGVSVELRIIHRHHIQNSKMKPQRKASVSQMIYCALPDVFTTEDVACELKKWNQKSPSRQIIYYWVRDRNVKRIRRGVFRKLL